MWIYGIEILYRVLTFVCEQALFLIFTNEFTDIFFIYKLKLQVAFSYYTVSLWKWK